MTINIEKIDTPKSLSEIAYVALKKSLLDMDLNQMPEEGRLDERDLAEKLGISRTPLREAINRLVVEGFLDVVPRKGIFVIKKSKEEILEIITVRAALEGMAAHLAAQKITEDEIGMLRDIFTEFDPTDLFKDHLKYSEANIGLHEMILQICGCGKLIEMANNLHDHMRWIRFRAVTFKDRLEQVHKEHLRIIDALEKRDPELAEREMRRHIKSLHNYIKESKDFL